MADPVELHPSIREVKSPRITSVGLAEYIIAKPGQQDTILHDHRFQSNFVAPRYNPAVNAIKAYCADADRNEEILHRELRQLRETAERQQVAPMKKEDAQLNIEAIERFIEGGNVWGAGGIPLFASPRFRPLSISGVEVSVQPSLIVGFNLPPAEKESVGFVFVRPQKGNDPASVKTDSKKAEYVDSRRNVARFQMALGWMLLFGEGLDERQIDKKRSAVWDFRLGEAVQFPSDRVSRVKQIEAACGQIARLWSTIEPKARDLAN